MCLLKERFLPRSSAPFEVNTPSQIISNEILSEHTVSESFGSFSSLKIYFFSLTPRDIEVTLTPVLLIVLFLF